MAKYNRNNIKLNDDVTLIRGVHSGRNGRVTKVYRKICVVVLGDKPSLSVRRSLRCWCKVNMDAVKSHDDIKNKNMNGNHVEVTPEKELKTDCLSNTSSSTRKNNLSSCDYNVDKRNCHLDFGSVYDSLSVSSGHSSISDEVTLPYLECNGLPNDFINSMIDHSMKMLVSLLKLKKKEKASTNIDGYLKKIKVLVKNNNK